MTSQQYEALCRFFVARELDIDVDLVKSARMPNPTRRNFFPYSHQIDLYWETWDLLTAHLNIANAKWRQKGVVGVAHVLLLRQVQLKVGAHKAVLICNRGFSARARDAAEDDGIGLLVVRPTFRPRVLPTTRPDAIVKE